MCPVIYLFMHVHFECGVKKEPKLSKWDRNWKSYHHVLQFSMSQIYYLHQGGHVSMPFVCLICQQDYRKTTGPIFMKLRGRV